MTTIPVTLWYDYPGLWFCTTQNYDASCEDGETWSGSHIENGNTPEDALQNYRDWLDGEGEKDFILEVEGPTESLEIHAWLVKREQKTNV